MKLIPEHSRERCLPLTLSRAPFAFLIVSGILSHPLMHILLTFRVLTSELIPLPGKMVSVFMLTLQSVTLFLLYLHQTLAGAPNRTISVLLIWHFWMFV